ncbi:MAG TPA: YihY/virulence factor BrkB family protein [Candidatus Thermoplasmatota archaeon]|nr:YihY/virulence factor BrkB family protein [Candidatus Thermoplasmatota archaeon]
MLRWLANPPPGRLATLRAAVRDFFDDAGPRRAAALAFYTIFSLAPFLVVLVAVSGVVFGPDDSRARLVSSVGELVGAEGAALVDRLLVSARDPGTGLVASVLGVLLLLVGASGVFGELKNAMNGVWNVESRHRSFVRTLRDRFASFTLFLGLAFLLLASLAVTTAITSLLALSRAAPTDNPVGWFLANAFLSLLTLTLLFAALLRYLPDVELRFRDVWGGAILSAALLVVSKELLGLYLGRSGFADAYGAAGSLVVILLWVYVAATVLLLGAEYVQASMAARGQAPAIGRHGRPRGARLTTG